MTTRSRKTILLATDQQLSVLNVLESNRLHPIAYTPYGYRPSENGLLSQLGFNGEMPDPITGHYHLGNGYRQFNPVLMRFNSPDSWSPFGEGGVNPYAYCGGDPRNWVDSKGRARYPAIARAIAQFRQSKLEISGKSKSISKPIATGSNHAASSSSSRNRAPEPTSRIKKAINERTRTADSRDLSSIIKKNEATLPIQNKYNISNHIKNINESTQGYDIAKKNYKFEKYPDPDVQHTWTDPDGNKLLDVAHFDITNSHFKNLSNTKKSNSRNYATVYRVEILRAAYIKNFTGIDLMRIRQ